MLQLLSSNDSTFKEHVRQSCSFHSSMRHGYSSQIATIQIQVLKTANARTAAPAQGAPHLHALLSAAESCAVKRALAESVTDNRGYFVATLVRLFAEAQNPTANRKKVLYCIC